MGGGGAGSIQDMIQRVRNNSALLKKGRYFDKAKENLHYHGKIVHLDTEATPEELEKIRKKLKKQRNKRIVVSVIVLLISAAITFIVFRFLFNTLT